MTEIEIVWPRPDISASSWHSAARPTTLTGLRVGFLDNTKNNLDVLFGRLAERLRTEHGVGDVVYVRKDSMARGMDEHHLSRLRSADFGITGVAD